MLFSCEKYSKILKRHTDPSVWLCHILRDARCCYTEIWQHSVIVILRFPSLNQFYIQGWILVKIWYRHFGNLLQISCCLKELHASKIWYIFTIVCISLTKPYTNNDKWWCNCMHFYITEKAEKVSNRQWKPEELILPYHRIYRSL